MRCMCADFCITWYVRIQISNIIISKNQNQKSLFHIQPFSSHNTMEYVQKIYCLHEILTPVTFDLACPPCAPCARRPEGYPPPLPCIDNCKNDDVLWMFIHLKAKTHSNSCRRDCHSYFAEIRVFLSVGTFNTHGICSKETFQMGFPRLTPTTVPWYHASVTHLHYPTCDWSPGREMSDWCDVVKVFDEGYRYNSNHSWCVCVFLMASWLQFRWEGVWNVKWTCECRIENGWVERATEKSLMMMPYDAFYAFWLCYTIKIIPTVSSKTLSSCPAYPFSHLTWKIQSSLKRVPRL